MSIIDVDRERLSGVVLGLLRYLPPKLWFARFVERLRGLNPTLEEWLTSASEPEVTLWPHLRVPDSWGPKLGSLPKKRGGPVPNRVVAPEAKIETAGWVALVNAVEGEVVESRFLYQDFSIARSLSDGKPSLLIHVNSGGLRRLHAGVAMGGVDPVLRVRPEDSVEHFISVNSLRLPLPKISEEEVVSRLAWINWQTIHHLLAGVRLEDDADFAATPPSYQKTVRRLLDDAVDLLEAAGLVLADFDVLSRLDDLAIEPASMPALGEVLPLPETPEGEAPAADGAEAEAPAADGAEAAAVEAAESPAEEKVTAEKPVKKPKAAKKPVDEPAPEAKKETRATVEASAEPTTDGLEETSEPIDSDIGELSIDPESIPKLTLG